MNEDAEYIIADLKNIPAFQEMRTIKTADLTDCLFALFKSLLPEEKLVIGILFRSKTPLTVRQIRRMYFVEMAAAFPKTAQILLQTEDISQIRQKILGMKESEISYFVSEFNKHIKKAVPSYYRINTILQYFEKEGIVSKRVLQSPVTKTVWFLHPFFTRVCSFVVRLIEDKITNKKEKPSITESEVLSILKGSNHQS